MLSSLGARRMAILAGQLLHLSQLLQVAPLHFHAGLRSPALLLMHPIGCNPTPSTNSTPPQIEKPVTTAFLDLHVSILVPEARPGVPDLFEGRRPRRLANGSWPQQESSAGGGGCVVGPAAAWLLRRGCKLLSCSHGATCREWLLPCCALRVLQQVVDFESREGPEAVRPAASMRISSHSCSRGSPLPLRCAGAGL